MSPVTINGMSAYRIAYRGYYIGNSSTLQNMTIEIFKNQNINIIYEQLTNTSGVSGITNGTTYVDSTIPAANTSYRLESDSNGNGWTVTPGMYRP